MIHKSSILHKYENVSIISNKLVFSLHFERYGISTPKMVAYNLGFNFFFKDRLFEITDKKSLISFFDTVFDQTGLKEIFIRPYSLYGGAGCFKLDKTTYHQQLEMRHTDFINAGHIMTCPIIQHPLINQIFPKSVNSLRFLSYIDNNRVVQLISVFMRFGVGESVIDNASSGGFFIGVNMEDGTLQEKGYYSSEHGGIEVWEHPDSKFKLEGFKIPFFEEACDLVIRAVKHIPDRFIGWDVAITKEGPTIIEANEAPNLHISDVAYDGLLRNPHMKKLIDEVLAEQ